MFIFLGDIEENKGVVFIKTRCTQLLRRHPVTKINSLAFAHLSASNAIIWRRDSRNDQRANPLIFSPCCGNPSHHATQITRGGGGGHLVLVVGQFAMCLINRRTPRVNEFTTTRSTWSPIVRAEASRDSLSA